VEKLSNSSLTMPYGMNFYLVSGHESYLSSSRKIPSASTFCYYLRTENKPGNNYDDNDVNYDNNNDDNDDHNNNN